MLLNGRQMLYEHIFASLHDIIDLVDRHNDSTSIFLYHKSPAPLRVPKEFLIALATLLHSVRGLLMLTTSIAPSRLFIHPSMVLLTMALDGRDPVVDPLAWGSILILAQAKKRVVVNGQLGDPWLFGDGIADILEFPCNIG